MNQITINSFFYLLFLFLFSNLSACTATTVATTGAEVAYNHHGIKKKLTDNYISWQANRKLYVDTKQFKNTNINVTTFNGNVLLTGQVPTLPQRNEVERIVARIEGINELHNLITLSPRTSALTNLSDSWITTKIKAQFIANQDLDPNLFKVVTEDGTVYLMGIVPPHQADIAVEIARTTEGVQNVVKVLSYLRVSRV